MEPILKILHLEDVPEDAMLVRYELEKANMHFEKLDVDNEDAYMAALDKFKPDIVLSDHSLPSFNSIEALEILKSRPEPVPFILITATISEEFAVNMMKAGAADYLLKDRTQRLPRAIENALEKHRAKIEKQKADNELARLFNTIDEVFFSHDSVNHRLTQISPACKKVYGYSPEEFLNNPRLPKSLIFPDDLGMIADNSERLAGGETVVAQYRINHKTEGIRWVETKMVPTIDAKGQLTGFDGVTRDITEKKRAEELIEQNNLRLREAAETQAAILNALPANIALLNEDGLVIAVNDSWKRFGEANGLKYPNHGIGRNYIDVAHAATGADKQEAENIVAGINDVIAGRKNVYNLEYPCDSPDEKRWFQAAVAPISGLKHNGVVIAHINITDRKQAEEKLRASEEQYRMIVETAQEGIAFSDPELKVVFVNKKMCELLEYGPGEIIGRHIYEFKPENEQDITLQRNQKRKTGVPDVHESVYISKSGKKLICSVTTSAVFGEDGTYRGTLGMVTDISERKAHEEALRKSEANLSAIIENTSDMVYSLDTGLNFITFNERFKKSIKKSFNFDVQQGTSIIEMLYAYDFQSADKWVNIYKAALKGEALQFVSEHTSYRRKGYLSYSINPIRQSGQVIGISCFLRDITKEKLDELSLIQSEANMRSVFENTDLHIILLDNNLKIVSYNSNAHNQAIKVFGKALTVGSSAFSYFPKDRWPLIRGIIEKVKNGETVDYETIYDLTEGGKNWFDVRWTGIFNEQREHLGLILTLKNITEKKNADLEREKMTNDLLRRNQDLEQFTYIISHNLRAPVANIIGLANLLGYCEFTDDDCAGTINALTTAVNNLDRVIIDLNTILQTGKQVNEKIEPVPLNALVAQISAEIHSLIEKNQASIVCEFNEVTEIPTIKSYLYSIFQNLMMNSIKYRCPNRNPLITIKTGRSKNGVWIRFTDNGRGIDLEKYGQHIFGLYKRFDFSVEGKGMGLFMVKMQAEALGGKINVKSELDKGTEFVVELPG